MKKRAAEKERERKRLIREEERRVKAELKELGRLIKNTQKELDRRIKQLPPESFQESNNTNISFNSSTINISDTSYRPSNRVSPTESSNSYKQNISNQDNTTNDGSLFVGCAFFIAIIVLIVLFLGVIGG